METILVSLFFWYAMVSILWQDEGKAPYLYVELDFKEVQIQNIHTDLIGVISNALASLLGLGWHMSPI